MRKVLDAEGSGRTDTSMWAGCISHRDYLGDKAQEVGRDQMQGLSQKGGATGLRVVSGGEEKCECLSSRSVGPTVSLRSERGDEGKCSTAHDILPVYRHGELRVPACPSLSLGQLPCGPHFYGPAP